MHGELKYPKEKLLGQIKTNRDAHAREYETAMVKYRVKVIESLNARLAVAQQNKDVPHSIDVVRPQEYLREYDRAIRMLEMTSASEIDLDAGSFAQLVMDEWSWKQNFASTTMSYNH